jgi:hypothetical protein
LLDKFVGARSKLENSRHKEKQLINERLRLVLETLEAGYDRPHHYLGSIEALTGQGWIASGDERIFSDIRTADGRRIYEGKVIEFHFSGVMEQFGYPEYSSADQADAFAEFYKWLNYRYYYSDAFSTSGSGA